MSEDSDSPTTSLTGLFVSSDMYPRVEKITKPEKNEVKQLIIEVTTASLKTHN